MKHIKLSKHWIRKYLAKFTGESEKARFDRLISVGKGETWKMLMKRW